MNLGGICLLAVCLMALASPFVIIRHGDAIAAFFGFDVQPFTDTIVPFEDRSTMTANDVFTVKEIPPCPGINDEFGPCGKQATHQVEGLPGDLYGYFCEGHARLMCQAFNDELVGGRRWV